MRLAMLPPLSVKLLLALPLPLVIPLPVRLRARLTRLLPVPKK